MKKLWVLVLCAVLLTSCSPKKYEKTVFSMDTQITMTAYGKEAEKALIRAEEEIKRINEKFGVSNADKILAERDSETDMLISRAEEIFEETDGAFNIYIAPVMRVWGFYSEEFTEKHYRVPTDSELNEALAEMKEKKYIDLGGIAKGYCADRLVDILKGQGVTSAVLSLGGNVSMIGNNPDGKPWTVGIKSPFDEGICATISVSDVSVITSGDYVRYFERDGKRYHHIIDTKTGYPANRGLSSVTVISHDGTRGDALSTALFAMGKDKAIDFWKKDKTFQMILIDKDGKIYYTDGLDLKTEYDKEIIKGQ